MAQWIAILVLMISMLFSQLELAQPGWLTNQLQSFLGASTGNQDGTEEAQIYEEDDGTLVIVVPEGQAVGGFESDD